MASSNGTITSPPNMAAPMVSVASLAIMLWDIFLHLPKDYKLATRHRVNSFFLIYWVARLTSLAYVLGVVLISTAAVENCDHFRIVGIFYPFAIPLSVLPFVMRIFALYLNNKYVVAFFSAMWLLVLAGCAMVPVGITGISLDTRNYCQHNKVIRTPALRSWLFIYDSFVFLATSWALMRNVYSDDSLVKRGMEVMVLGRHLFPFSKSILRDGQAYYLIVLILKLVFLAVPSSIPALRFECTIAVALISNLSSHVYRNMRLGFYQDGTNSATTNQLEFKAPTPSTTSHASYVGTLVPWRPIFL